MKKSFYNYRLILGVTSLSVVIMAALLIPFISPYDPLQMDIAKGLQAPSVQHLFGLDENGVDLFSQVIYGARVSLFVAFTVVLINLLFGLLFGSVSGWWGNTVDQILMRIVDFFSAFPRFLLALAILAMMGSSVYNLIFAMCLSGWTSFARLVRAEVLYLKKEDYVLGAISYGSGTLRIFFYHIWPNLLGLLLVQMAFSLVAVVIAEAGLSFLGLGLPSDIPSWGRLISSGRHQLLEAPHLSIFPGMALFILVLGFQLCAEELRIFFSPNQGVSH